MRKYKHDFTIVYRFENKNKYGTIAQDTASNKFNDLYYCFFWDVEKEIPKSIYNQEYCPVAILYLRELPSVGTYVNFDNILYIITSICIVAKETNNTKVYYDFEVEKVEEGKIKTVL